MWFWTKLCGMKWFTFQSTKSNQKHTSRTWMSRKNQIYTKQKHIKKKTWILNQKELHSECIFFPFEKTSQTCFSLWTKKSQTNVISSLFASKKKTQKLPGFDEKLRRERCIPREALEAVGLWVWHMEIVCPQILGLEILQKKARSLCKTRVIWFLGNHRMYNVYIRSNKSNICFTHINICNQLYHMVLYLL